MQTGDNVIVPANAPSYKTTPELAGVSETMLWGLHNRASEARRVDGALIDPDCVRIHDAIDYDFAHHFGEPMGSLSTRAAEIDRVIRRWLKSHPDGLVVINGEHQATIYLGPAQLAPCSPLRSENAARTATSLWPPAT